MYQRVFFGKVTHPVNNSLPDLSGFEKAAVWPCALAALLMGVAPILWLGAIDPAVQAALTPFAQVASKVVGQGLCSKPSVGHLLCCKRFHRSWTLSAPCLNWCCLPSPLSYSSPFPSRIK